MRRTFIALVLAALTGGCGDYKRKTEPFYEAVARVHADVDSHAAPEAVAADIVAARAAEKQWEQAVGEKARSTPSGEDLHDALVLYQTGSDCQRAKPGDETWAQLSVEAFTKAGEKLRKARASLDAGS